MTADSDLDLASNNDANVYIMDGLTLNNATVLLGNAAGTTYGDLYFSGTETWAARARWSSARAAATSGIYEPRDVRRHADDRFGDHGPGQQRHHLRTSYYGNDTIVNQGTIAADDSGGLVGGFVYDSGLQRRQWLRSTADTIDTSGVTNPAPQAV